MDWTSLNIRVFKELTKECSEQLLFFLRNPENVKGHMSDW